MTRIYWSEFKMIDSICFKKKNNTIFHCYSTYWYEFYKLGYITCLPKKGHILFVHYIKITYTHQQVSRRRTDNSIYHNLYNWMCYYSVWCLWCLWCLYFVVYIRLISGSKVWRVKYIILIKDASTKSKF